MVCTMLLLIQKIKELTTNALANGMCATKNKLMLSKLYYEYENSCKFFIKLVSNENN